MTSAWKPLPDKENPELPFIPSAKARGIGPVKISNRGAIPKKQVFGDLKNTIQNFKANGGECEIPKDSKSDFLLPSCDRKIKQDDLPEPELLPASIYNEEDYEDCLLPGLKFSVLQLENLTDIFGKISKTYATHVEPDSPLSLPQGRIELDFRLEFPEDELYEIEPVWDDGDI